MLNKSFLMGRLTADPELKTGGGGTQYCSFTLAVDRRGKDAGADFISCTAFKSTAEYLTRYGAKGRLMVIEGRIQTGSYTAADGHKVYTWNVIADDVTFADRKGAAGQQETTSQEDDEIPSV